MARIRRLEDGSIRMEIWGTMDWHLSDFNETIQFNRQAAVPRWIRLSCGHFASNAGLGTLEDELLTLAPPHNAVSACCSLCGNVIFERVPMRTIDAHGLNNFVAQSVRLETTVTTV